MTMYLDISRTTGEHCWTNNRDKPNKHASNSTIFQLLSVKATCSTTACWNRHFNLILRGQVCDWLTDKSSLVNQAKHLQSDKQIPWVSETLRLTFGNQPTHGVESRTPPWTALLGVDIIARLCWQLTNDLFLNWNRTQSKQWERKLALRIFKELQLAPPPP